MDGRLIDCHQSIKMPGMEPSIPAARYRRLPQKSGIYLIGFSLSDDSYVGGTTNIRKRCYGHLRKMKRGVSTAKLQAAADVNRIVNIRFQIIELCPPELLGERELFWRDLLKPNLNKSERQWSDKSMKRKRAIAEHDKRFPRRRPTSTKLPARRFLLD